MNSKESSLLVHLLPGHCIFVVVLVVVFVVVFCSNSSIDEAHALLAVFFIEHALMATTLKAQEIRKLGDSEPTIAENVSACDKVCR